MKEYDHQLDNFKQKNSPAGQTLRALADKYRSVSWFTGPDSPKNPIHNISIVNFNVYPRLESFI